MGRKLRSFEPGVPSHLTAHGVDDEPIFRCDLDRIRLLALLKDVARRAQLRVLAWCLMTTHYHLLVLAATEPRVSWAMQTLNSVYAREFNHRHFRRGHLFGERFTDTAVETELHFQAAVDYVLENPVRAGLVRRVEDWRWSGGELLEPRTQN